MSFVCGRMITNDVIPWDICIYPLFSEVNKRSRWHSIFSQVTVDRLWLLAEDSSSFAGLGTSWCKENKWFPSDVEPLCKHLVKKLPRICFNFTLTNHNRWKMPWSVVTSHVVHFQAVNHQKQISFTFKWWELYLLQNSRLPNETFEVHINFSGII